MSLRIPLFVGTGTGMYSVFATVPATIIRVSETPVTAEKSIGAATSVATPVAE